MTAVLRLWVISPSSGFDGEGEEVGDLRQVGFAGGGEFPATEERGIVRVGDGESVVAENFGRVVLGVEADTQQMSAS